MTNEQATNMLKAKLECLKRETSGTDFDCNNSNCDECSLNYEQGNMVEQKEALDMTIKALEKEPCEDVISRAEAEAIFRNARSKLNPSDYKTADEFNTRDLMLLNAEQLIHLLPSVKPQEPKWIPVSERLPKDKTYVLTTIKIPNRIAHVRSGWYEGGFIHNDNGDVWKATDMEVIAWMPLPDPYKAESEE